MKKWISRIGIVTTLILLVIFNTFAQSEATLEERVAILEKENEDIRRILAELGLTEDSDIPQKDLQKEDSNILQDNSPISVMLQELTYNKSDASNNYANDYSDWISFTFLFTNNLEKSIRAVKGAVVFMDLFGDQWWSIGLALNDTIEPGETISWIGEIDYNGFVNSHKTAKNTDPENVLVRYDVSQILFEDGSQVSYN